MKCYLISYDLNEPGQDYPSIIKAIETYETRCKILKSQWLLLSNKTADEIFRHLNRFIDTNDELFVCEINWNCCGKFNESLPCKWVDNLRRSRADKN